MKNGDKPAYPITNNNGFATSFEYVNNKNQNCGAVGLTKREYFAAMAMQSMIRNNGSTTYHIGKNVEDVCGDIAEASIAVADELLKQLEQ